MEKHIQLLGSLYIAFSIIGILIALIVFVFVVGGGLLSGEEEAIAVTSIVGTVLAFFFILFSIPGLIGGIGLLKMKPWSRMLVLVLGFLNLMNIPFGTALGIYTIWALLQDESEKLFKHQSK